ncbi:hypothetical protein CQW23_31836 [Capsicum baccatum]|uniref:SEC63 domain-containing protein n=1 Tax=Capsicum baccatum TaxID=33114 RepID=A0A2G2V6F7_CAPBA|nr:hypothetical protein CQW23_31836 [Capsicum baccatum]
MSESQLMDIDHFCEGYPYIDLSYDVLGGGNVRAGDNVTLQVTLERDLKGRSEVRPVLAPKYPKDKEEGWWLVVGDIESNQLVAIKRVNLHRKSGIKLDFTAPAEAGTRKYKLYFMCDSYLGCDEEHIFALDVKEWIEANHEDSPAYVMPKGSSMDSHSVKSLSDLRIEPSCCSSDVKDPHAVMADEFSVLLVSLPLNVIAVGCKWACEASAVKGALNP